MCWPKATKVRPVLMGQTFEMIEAEGLEHFLTVIQNELKSGVYYPDRRRKVLIPKSNGKTRELSIPTIKDRVVEGALKLILEPIFEADFMPGSYGYRPKKNPAEAVERIAEAIIKGKTRIIDVDLKSYFDSIAHAELFTKVAKRVDDKNIMHLLKLIVKATGKKGIAQGGPLSPLLSNIYLNEVDKMLEKAKAYTKQIDGYEHVEYARFADDLVIAIDGYKKWQWLETMVYKRLQEELSKI